MNLNGTIRRLRRAKGLTQEQVAQALGVSGPAVNKWERGACCPDLALLAPLARLLDTDLNTLLSFREELTGAEIAAFTEELYTLAQSGGIDAAFLRAEELLHRWPDVYKRQVVNLHMPTYIANLVIHWSALLSVSL